MAVSEETKNVNFTPQEMPPAPCPVKLGGIPLGFTGGFA